MQSNKLNLLTTKRKGDTSHGTHTKHQLQLFKTFGMIPWKWYSFHLFKYKHYTDMFQIYPMLVHMRILLLLWYVTAAHHLLGYGHLLHIWPSRHPPFYNDWQSTWWQAHQFLTVAAPCPVSLLSPITSMSLLTSPNSQIQKKSYVMKSTWVSK